MTKVVQMNKKEPVNPREYGYRPNTSVTISSDLLGALGGFLGQVMQDETNMYFDTTDGNFVQADGKVLMTAKGASAMQLIQTIDGVHANMVDAGIAVHQSVLQAEADAPKFEINPETPTEEGE